MLVFFAGVIAGGFLLQITSIEWAVILFCCGGVLGAEMINTAIECVVDMITTDHHPTAEKIKDLAAGAVLVFSLFSAVVGGIIFVPHIIALF